MTRPSRAARLAALVFTIGAITSGLAWANGQEFFDPGANAKVDLAYVGRVRDVSGRFVKAAEVVFWSPAAGLTFPSVTDEYGHYRTPDIGASLKEMALEIDTNDLQLTCAMPGYELVRTPKVPKKTNGYVVVDFVLRPVGAAADAATSADAGGSHGLIWFVPGLLALVVIGAAVRR
jgi:hypothetical protein